MIDPVEKFFEIKINYDVVARGNVSLRLGYRLMGGASRSEAVAVPGKRRVPPLLENLQQGLLDQSVDDARYAELSDPAVRLGDFDPLDRLRLVGSRVSTLLRDSLARTPPPLIARQPGFRLLVSPRMVRSLGNR
jgi:hypothetical protein